VSEALQVGVVGNWRYLIRPREGEGVLAIVRRDVERGVLEDEMALCYSEEVAEVIAVALVAHERRKNWPLRRFI
jgi:hypothetical protein